MHTEVCVLLFLLIFNFSSGHHNPHFAPNRCGIVQLFEWTFRDIAIECEEYLAKWGYGGVQVSPVSEHIVLKRRSWLDRYMPLSYIIDSRSGNELDFIDMTRRCNAVGIRIYVDVVLNHMAKGDNKTIGTAGSKIINNHIYPSVPYVAQHFHRPCSIDNYFDAHQVRNCELMQMPDLDQSLEVVRERISIFLNHLISLGVAGFRVDRCKHMWPNDLKDIYNRVNNLSIVFNFPTKTKPFFCQEVFDIGTEPISKTEYNYLGRVTEFLYPLKIADIFRRVYPLTTLVDWGPRQGFLEPQTDALVFIDNPELQRHPSYVPTKSLTIRELKLYKMATAFMLAHPYGEPRIMSSYQYDDIYQGPPINTSISGTIVTASVQSNAKGDCENGWICEHRIPEIYNMLRFRIVVNGSEIRRWQEIGPHQIGFCRGFSGFVAINNDPVNDLEHKFEVCMPAGRYCDIVTGYLNPKFCSHWIDVDEDSDAMIKIPFNSDNGVIAIHLDSRI